MLSYKKYSPLFIVALISVFLGACKKPEVSAIQAKYFIKYFGGAGTQAAYHVESTSDGGYIIIGTTDSKGNGGTDMFVVKTDEFGNELWANTYGGSGDDEGRCVREVNGGYVLLGTLDNGGGDTDVYFIMVNSEGDVQWTQNYGGASLDVAEQGVSIEKTSDGGYALIGLTAEVNGGKSGGTSIHDKTDIFLVRTDGNGNEIWTAVYGFNGPEATGINVCQVNDSVFYTCASVLPAPSNLNRSDMIVTRLRAQDAGGGVYTISASNNLTKASPVNESFIKGVADIIYENDNIKVLGVDTLGGRKNIFVLSINVTAITSSKAWYHTYGGSSDEEPFGFSKCSDGGYIIAGYTMSEGEGNKDIYLLKIDANGNQQWTKTFGGEADDIGYSVAQASDGGYVICGSVTFGGNGIGSNRVMSLIKTDENGELKGK